MRINNVQQFNERNSAQNPNFRGAKEIEAASKIIKKHADISCVLVSSSLIEPWGPSLEDHLATNILQMLEKISDIYKIEADKNNIVKTFPKEFANKKILLVLKALDRVMPFCSIPEALYRRKITSKIGVKFVQSCEKLQKQ